MSEGIKNGRWPLKTIPKSWEWANFHDIYCNLTSSQKKIPKKQYLIDGNLSVVDQGIKLIGGYTNDLTMRYLGELPAIIWGDHTRCVKYIDFEFAQGADGVKVLRPFPPLNIKYLYRALSTIRIPDKGYSRHYKFLKDSRFPIPPLNEQKRIADKIDALFARSEKAENALTSIPTLLNQYRQSILAAAFRGDLTKDWRINNDQNISTYLDAIKVKRTEEAITPSQKKDISIIYKQYDEAEFDIPTTWSFAKLAKLVSNFSYGSSQKSLPTGSIPVIRMGNIQRGEINWEKLVFSSDKKEIEKYTLEPNDVLFNRTNSPKLVGKTAIYRGEKPAIYAGYLIRVRPHKILNPEYLNYCLGSQYGRDYCWKVKSDGVSQSNINAKKLAAFKVPLCCPEEQALIVEKIKENFSFIERIEHQYNKASDQISTLKISILTKAFRGELVPQNPNDEPANELLKRIKIEREKREENFKSKTKVARKKIRGKGEKMIISVVDALKQSEKTLSAQQLLSAAGYPDNADTDQIEQFFLDIRKAINKMQLVTWRENDQDYFKVAG